jgi:galactose mutarotase-like enzyme
MTTPRIRNPVSLSQALFRALGQAASRLHALSSSHFVHRLDITTNQPAVQVYTAYWLDTPRKAVHGGPSLNYTKWSAVAIEQEGYIDAINTPEWGVDQICACLKQMG